MRLFINGLEERIAPSRAGFFRLFSRIHEMAWSAHSSADGVAASGNGTFEHHQEVVVSGDGAAATVIHNSGQGVIVTNANGHEAVVVSDANHQQSVVAVSASPGCTVRIQNDGSGFQSVVVSMD